MEKKQIENTDKTVVNCFSQGITTKAKRQEKTQTKRFAKLMKFKLERAQGECLGIGSRRRTRQAAKSCGELQISPDPQVSEWGNPTM